MTVDRNSGAAAHAIAEATAAHSDDNFAAKADIAGVEGKIQAMETKFDAKFNIVIALASAIFVTLMAQQFTGG